MSDLIDRQAAIDACLNGWNKDYKEIVADIKALPPVEQKQGKWKKEWYGDTYGCYEYVCSKCGCGEDMDFDYCPNCGAKMCGGEE